VRDIRSSRSAISIGEGECVRRIGTLSADSIRASGHPRRINRPDT
jgi:hypothetical protein